VLNIFRCIFRKFASKRAITKENNPLNTKPNRKFIGKNPSKNGLERDKKRVIKTLAIIEDTALAKFTDKFIDVTLY